MNNILKSIIRKEFIHVWKDPQTLLIIIIMPILMLFLYGYAITLEMRDIKTIISDHSATPQSRQLIRKISSSGFFKTNMIMVKEKDIDPIFQKKLARCIVIIPADYARDLAQKIRTDVQVLIDASDPNAANLINNYLQAIVYQYNKEINQELPVPFIIEPRFLYNPDLRSAVFFVPGLIAIILMLVSALLTSIAITREKELGTMEQLLVSPVRPVQIVIGKVIPYLILGFINGMMIILLGKLLFKVPFNGSVLAIMAMLILYIFTGLSFGLLVSTVAKTQRVAMIMAMMMTLLPTIMLSGFIFPVDSMPVLFQIVSYIIPAKHFIHIIRGVMLKGLGIFELWPQVLFLILLSLFLILVSIKKFKDKLE